MMNKNTPPAAGSGAGESRKESPATGAQAPAAHQTDHGLVPAKNISGFSLGGRVDVRGWSVLSSDDKPVGTIDRLLVEEPGGKVRYFGIALTGQAAGAGAGEHRHVLVPVGAARRLDDRRMMKLDVVTSEQIARAPRIADRPVTRVDEEATLAAFGVPMAKDTATADRYAGALFDEARALTASPH